MTSIHPCHQADLESSLPDNLVYWHQALGVDGGLTVNKAVIALPGQ
jgi:hypothetical protein